MTDATPTPAGWYADASAAGQLRWWDGTAWTEHVAAANPLERPTLPAGAKIYSPFIWLVVFLPLLTLPLLFTWQPSFRFVTGPDGTMTVDRTSMYGPGYFLMVAAGWILYGLSVFFAYRDWRALHAAGVVRPFHWAWTFLNPLVYIIGRSVIVRRVARPRGLAPIWAYIGVVVVSLVVTSIWTVQLVSQMLSAISQNLPQR